MAFTARDVLPLTQARERTHLLLIDEAGKGLDDIAVGKVKDAKTTLTALKRINRKTGGFILVPSRLQNPPHE